MTEVRFREEADSIAYVDHETRVFHDVVLSGPAQLRRILEALKAERTRIDTCSEVRVLGSEVVVIPECTSINRGGEAGLDADPVVVVVLALI